MKIQVKEEDLNIFLNSETPRRSVARKKWVLRDHLGEALRFVLPSPLGREI